MYYSININHTLLFLCIHEPRHKLKTFIETRVENLSSSKVCLASYNSFFMLQCFTTFVQYTLWPIPVLFSFSQVNVTMF